MQIQLEKSGIGLRGTPRCVGGGKISGAEVCLSSGGVEPHNVDALWLANESPQRERTTPIFRFSFGGGGSLRGAGELCAGPLGGSSKGGIC